MKDRFINLAIQQAQQSLMTTRLGAVLVRKKHVIGAGYNRKDHPLLYKGKVPKLHPNFGMHAEVAALHGLGYNDTNDAILYVVRLRKDNSIGMSKPCTSCRWYIGNVGIKRVIFSDDAGNFNTMRIT